VDAGILTGGLAAGGGFLAASVGAVLALRAFGNARLLASTPPTPVTELSEGLHEVAGTWQAANGLVAPVTGRPCAYYRLLLEQRRRNLWETVLDQREALPGRLVDSSGRVTIDLPAADVVIASPDRVRTGVYAVPSVELTALLARVAPPATAPFGPFLRWREESLADGDRLVAVGTARADDAGWALVAEAGAPLLVSDRDELEVIRHQSRAGRRWVTVGLLGAGAAAWGVLDLTALLGG
jgi:hypothetical protein